MAEKLLELISNIYSITTIIGAVAIFIYQRNKSMNDRFKQYAMDLYKEDNLTAQITSAILLRSYLRPIYHLFTNPYKRDATNLIVAILRHIPNGNLQKTLADSISYISRADGQDFQRINLHAASIKPESRINFEITDNPKYLEERTSMRCADFYRSNITQCCIYHINAEKAIFFETLLCQTSFTNCILKNANFQNADVSKLKFIDCSMDGANFKGARCLETASVTENGNTYRLIDCIDINGKFEGYKAKQRYFENGDKKSIFISRLGVMNAKQLNYYKHITELIKKQYNYTFEEIKPEDYWDSNQITMIKDRMAKCSGMIVFAFSYMKINEGKIANISQQIVDEDYSSPWLHIEAAMANAMYNFPTMVFAEENISCNGIFDDKVIQNDELMFKINFNGTLSENDEKSLSGWSRAVDRYKQTSK